MEYIYTDEDGNQTKFTDEMVKVALDERNQLRKTVEESKVEYEKLSDLKRDWVSKLFKAREDVTTFFKERYDSGEDDITVSVEDVNRLLTKIGAETLKLTYTISGTIDFTVAGIQAESEAEAQEIVENELTLEFNGEGELDDWSVSVNYVNQE